MKKVLTMLIALFLSAVALDSIRACKMRSAGQVRVTPSESETAVKYSEADMKLFWNFYVDPIVIEGLVGNTYRLSEIRDRFQNNLPVLISKYGQRLGIDASTSYNRDSRNVIAGAAVEKGKPIIRIFVPALIDIFRRNMAGKSRGGQMFEAHIVSIVLHELEHLLQEGSMEPSRGRAELLENEVDAWAKTCEYVIAVFVRNGYILDDSTSNYFAGWLSCGERNNACWRSFVSDQYQDVLDQRFK